MSSDAHTLRHTNSSVSGSVRVRLEEVQGSVPEPEYSQSARFEDGGYSDDESDDDLLELNPRGSSCCFCCGGRDTEAKKLARVGKLKRKVRSERQQDTSWSRSSQQPGTAVVPSSPIRCPMVCRRCIKQRPRRRTRQRTLM